MPGTPAPLAVRQATADAATFRQVFLERGYEIRPTSAPSLSIIDGGANAGYTTTLHAVACPDTRILALEPDPENFALLRRNTSAFPMLGCCRLRSGTIVRPPDWPNAREVHWANRAVGNADAAIEAITVDDAVGLLGVVRLVFLKPAIEGSERELLAVGDTSWLDRTGTSHVGTHGDTHPGSSAALCRALGNRSFRQYVRGEHLPIELR